METTTTKADPICVSVIMLQQQIKHLRAENNPMLGYMIDRLEDVLETMEQVNEGLKQAYAQSRSAEDAARLFAILHP